MRFSARSRPHRSSPAQRASRALTAQRSAWGWLDLRLRRPVAPAGLPERLYYLGDRDRRDDHEVHSRAARARPVKARDLDAAPEGKGCGAKQRHTVASGMMLPWDQRDARGVQDVLVGIDHGALHHVIPVVGAPNKGIHLGCDQKLSDGERQRAHRGFALVGERVAAAVVNVNLDYTRGTL